MWEARQVRSTIALVSALSLASCVTAQGEFSLVLNQYETPVGWLHGYRGSDANFVLDRRVREYCGGAFRALHRTASDDGADHGLTFECRSAAIGEGTAQATSLGAGRYDLRVVERSEISANLAFDSRAEKLCGGPFVSEVRNPGIVICADCGAQSGGPPGSEVQATITCSSGAGLAERIPGPGWYSISYGPNDTSATLTGYTGDDVAAKLSAFVKGICQGPYRVIKQSSAPDVACSKNCPIKDTAVMTFECENNWQ